MEQVFRAISLELVDADSAFAARADAAANDAGRSWKPLGVMRGEVQRLGGILDHVRSIGAVHAGRVGSGEVFGQGRQRRRRLEIFKTATAFFIPQATRTPRQLSFPQVCGLVDHDKVS